MRCTEGRNKGVSVDEKSLSIKVYCNEYSNNLYTVLNYNSKL